MKQELIDGYVFKGDSLFLGGILLDQKPVPKASVNIPLATLNRHGLIAGATGTGKTKTIQRIAEDLSEQGVSVLLMDVKGDLSGLAEPGTLNPKIEQREKTIGEHWEPRGYPVELLSISGEKGIPLRATVSEFGPLLFSKILELNENQEGVVSLLFKFCEDKQIALDTLADFKSALQSISKIPQADLINYGGISTASVGVIARQLLQLEQQGGDRLFGAPSFDVNDLVRTDNKGRGVISILRLGDMQDRPKLFSAFMLCLLTEVYAKFPEIGDQAKPKLLFFVDEAHLLFDSASKALLQKIVSIVKLIRSKGVGIYFCTQSPSDIPEAVLSQLGAKIQHALRAFTAKDRKDIKLVSQNYPDTSNYNTEKLLTELGIGEALITVLNEKGNPTPLVHSLLAAPRSRMDVLSDAEQDAIVANSKLRSYLNTVPQKEQKLEVPSAVADDPSILTQIDQATKNPIVRSFINKMITVIMRIIFPTGRRK